MAIYAGVDTFWMTHDNRGRLHAATKGIVQDGLVLNLDAGVTQSYPGNGTTWYDLSGNENHASLINGPTFINNFGGAINQDGSNDYIQITNNSDFLFEGDTSFTIQIIFEKNAFKYDYSTLIGCGDQDSTFRGGWHCTYYNDNNYSGPNGVITLSRHTPTSSVGSIGYFFSSTTDSNGVISWTLMYESGVGYKIYKNISLVSEVNTGLGPSSQRVAGAPPLYIGTRAGKPSVRLTNNKFFIVNIYNRALSANEVQKNFNVTRKRFGI
jgi:hypothetical protein